MRRISYSANPLPRPKFSKSLGEIQNRNMLMAVLARLFEMARNTPVQARLIISYISGNIDLIAIMFVLILSFTHPLGKLCPSPFKLFQSTQARVFQTFNQSQSNPQYIFLYPSGGKREHVNKVRQPVKVEPKRYLISTASRASCADIFGS